MTQNKFYIYLGTNGTITSPVYLEGIYSVCKVILKADEGKMLTNGVQIVSSITVPQSEVNKWSEIDKQQ